MENFHSGIIAFITFKLHVSTHQKPSAMTSHVANQKNEAIVTEITSGNTDSQMRLLVLSAFCIAFTITFLVIDFSGLVMILLLVQIAMLCWLNHSFRNFYDLLLQQNGDIMAKNFWKSIKVQPEAGTKINLHKFPIAYSSNPYVDIHLTSSTITVKMPEKFLLTEDLSAEYVSKLELLLRKGW